MNDRAILLVEDNPDDEALTLRALKKNNIMNDIIVAHDGVEALDYLHGTGPYAGKPLPPLPQLVLLDLKLPKVDGLTVLKNIRAHERTKLLPVVVLTSSSEIPDVIACYGSHCNSYVRKPVDFNEFINSVARMGIYWLLLNQSPPEPA